MGKHYHAEYLYYTLHNFNSGSTLYGTIVCLCPTKKTQRLNGLNIIMLSINTTVLHNFNSGAKFYGTIVCLCPTKKTLRLNGLNIIMLSIYTTLLHKF